MTFVRRAPGEARRRRYRSAIPAVARPVAYPLVRIQKPGPEAEIVPMISGLTHAIASALRAGGRRSRD